MFCFVFSKIKKKRQEEADGSIPRQPLSNERNVCEFDQKRQEEEEEKKKKLFKKKKCYFYFLFF